MFLYVITNRVNGKQYVGITRNPKCRKREHLSGRRGSLVALAVRKYGRQKFDMEVWYEADEEWIKLMECRAILALSTLAPTGYNLRVWDSTSPGSIASLATSMMKPLTLNGINFASMEEAVAHFHTSYATIRKHLQRGDKEFLAYDRVEAGRKLGNSVAARYEWTEEQRQRASDTRGGAQHPRAKRVVVNGKEYGCLKRCCKGSRGQLQHPAVAVSRF